jgi:hypothetical protein
MASLPFGEAEARENNQRHENNFYRFEVWQTEQKTRFLFFWKSELKTLILRPSYLREYSIKRRNWHGCNSLPLLLKNIA